MKVFKENNFFGNKLSGNVSKMLNLRKNNRFIKELEEVNRKSPPADMEMLRELNLMMKQIENIPTLPQTGSTAPEEDPRQQITLELVRHCLGRST